MPKAQRLLSSLGAAGALCFVLVGQNLFAATSYDIEMLGFTDAEHTSDIGARYSAPYAMDESSQVIGWSARFDGGTPTGQSTWSYDNGVITRMGFHDADCTRADGWQWSAAYTQNAAGQAIGYSDLYSGSTSLGWKAWFYNHGITTRLGFVGSEYTASDGGQMSEPRALNDAGQVIGWSYRYSGSTNVGQSAWLYDAGTTIRLGYTDAAHTGSDGYQYSEARAINTAGQIVGYSWRPSNGKSTAWLDDQGTMTRLGLIDPNYSSLDSSTADSINAAGQVIGQSAYGIASSPYYGADAWLYDGGVTTRVGLTDAGHTRNDGWKVSQASSLSEAGGVAGFSYRYSGGTNTGQSAWVYDGSVTTRIGLTDTLHTRSSDGYQDSAPEIPSKTPLNNAGQVIGRSRRYVGAAEAGQSAWLYSGGTTTLLGFTDLMHKRAPDGYRYSEALSLNDAGQVIGFSKRYDLTADLGQSGWFFDNGLNQLVALEFLHSLRRLLLHHAGVSGRRRDGPRHV